MLRRLESGEELYLRSNLSAHLSASAWVTNQTHDKVLMAYHKIFDTWAWLGGHADGDHDLLAVAHREIKEETGLETHPINGEIASIEILTVKGHEKHGKYVPSHLHFNITYLFEGDDQAPIHNKPDENTGVAWYGLDEAMTKVKEPWMTDRIYSKLNARLREL